MTGRVTGRPSLTPIRRGRCQPQSNPNKFRSKVESQKPSSQARLSHRDFWLRAERFQTGFSVRFPCRISNVARRDSRRCNEKYILTLLVDVILLTSTELKTHKAERCNETKHRAAAFQFCYKGMKRPQVPIDQQNTCHALIVGNPCDSDLGIIRCSIRGLFFMQMRT
jgi:hypothetical protein